jgi:predicted nucleotide-binding protein
VVSFHNPKGRPIHPEERREMDVAVKALEAVLNLSPRKLAPRERVFIVHGRDERHREELVKMLEGWNIKAVVIQTLARTGQDLLGFVEEQIRMCLAGFVLLTPDDEGRHYEFGAPMRQRARQNVIFEGGYLTALFRGIQRICFLRIGDVEIPSDLNGLLMEQFEGSIEPERIRDTLRQWGLKGQDRPTAPASKLAASDDKSTIQESKLWARLFRKPG